MKYLGNTGPGWVAAALCAGNFLLAFSILVESLKSTSEHVAQRPHLDQWLHTLSQPKIGLLVVVFFLATFCFSCFESTLPLVVSDNFHLDIQSGATSATTVVYLFAYCGIIGAFVQGGAIGRLVKCMGEPKLIALSLILTAASFAWLPFINGTAQLSWGVLFRREGLPWVAMLGALAFLSVGTSLTRPPLFGLLSNLTPAHEQGATIGVAQGAGSLARILGPIFATTLLHYCPPLPYLTCAVVLLATTVLIVKQLCGESPPLDRPQRDSPHREMSARRRKAPWHAQAVALSLALGVAVFSMAARGAATAPSKPTAHFEVLMAKSLTNSPSDGRLFVVLSQTNHPEPRLMLGRTGTNAPVVLARDLKGFAPGATAVLDHSAFTFPVAKPSAPTPGDYFVQALFDSSTDLRSPNAPGNLFSTPQRIHFDWTHASTIHVELTQQVPPEQVPADTEQIKFIKLPSKLLSQFHNRPMFLRAGIILPRDYESEPSRQYPLWVRIGGSNTRYTSVKGLMATNSEFRKIWLAEDTPRFILLQLDGAGPFGDPYQVNSANNGPYGDALVQELIPCVEAKFRAVGKPHARVLSGSSTGGWVSLALQIFYPDAFNGAWSSCPDPVDFRAMELMNIYADDNAYVDNAGQERPSERDLKGVVTLTLRREAGVENLLGRGNSYTMSGQSWGAWNAVFGPRGANGLPLPLWDPQTGKIDHAIAEQWKKYDLRLVLEANWKTLAPKLRGKLHIAAGEADAYFLNNAVHLLDQSLAKANPPFEGKIIYGPGKGHGWMDLTLRQMLDEMQAAVKAK